MEAAAEKEAAAKKEAEAVAASKKDEAAPGDEVSLSPLLSYAGMVWREQSCGSGR